MESIIPWKEWMELIAPFYIQKERGRKLIPLETMLRMYLMQNWFGLSDEGIEDAIYDSYAMKRFLKIDFSTEQTPDATTLLHFRHLLEKHNITRKIFDDVKQRLLCFFHKIEAAARLFRATAPFLTLRTYSSADAIL